MRILKRKISFLVCAFLLIGISAHSVERYITSFVNAKFYTLSTSNVPTRTTISGADTGYIAPNDLCTILDTSNSEYWKVSYPTGSGQKSAYVKKSYIVNSTAEKNIKLKSNTTVYQKSDMKTSFGTAYTTDTVTQIGEIQNGKAQVKYNITGGWKLGWIYSSNIQETSSNSSFVNSKFYTLSTSNVPTRTTISGADTGYIAPNDLCTVLDTSNSEYWKVSYPTGSGQKSAYIKKSFVVNSTSEKSIKLRSNTTVYQKSDMKNSFGTAYTTDTVTQIGAIQNGKAQIKYNVTGGWKLGWIYSSNINDGSTPTPPPVANTTLTRGLYNNSSLSSKITCGFDGYVSTPGRHEGIDFALGYGKNIYSLVAGEVINVIQGSNNGSLSTISIYDSASDKSVIYLHAAPKVSIGQKVSKGTLIGTESNRGAPTHTHVEVRNGRQTHAAKSVNDPVLNNQNPAPYWNSKGYKVE